MGFESTKEKLRELASCENEAKKYYTSDTFEKVAKSMEKMIEILEYASKGGTVIVGREDKDMLIRGANIILDTAKDDRITEWFREFSLEYAKLMGNFDDNAVGDGRLKRKAQIIQRLINSNYALRDLLQLTKEMKNLDRNREATRQARHFLNSLDEEG